MKKMLILVFVIIVFAAMTGFIILQKNKEIAPNSTANSSAKTSGQNVQTTIDAPVQTTIAENLDTPWALALLPDNRLLVTERPGRVSIIDLHGKTNPVVAATISSVKEIGEGGLLGIALHPQFSSNHYVYLYYTYSVSGNDTLNRVVRMTFSDDTLHDEKIIVDNIPGASNHDGGRIKFGPDNLLYIGTGDAQEPSQAQSTTTLGGKILRVTDEGKAAPGNPFNNLTYSYGHRNVQGLTWDTQKNLWATEHGRSGVTTGFDELNLIQNGKNYGWPEIQGDEAREGMLAPQINSGPITTWAPSGAAFVGNSVYFAGLKGKSLYQAVIENGKVARLDQHLVNQYGRLREVIAAPNGLLYITTSNRDGRGNPQSMDDRIIQINPAKL
jgi:glucose/arabinose dehydrogenase